jgi:hypothetical protein
MAVAKCLIDHIKRSRFLDSADRVLVGEPAKERNVREKTPWGGPSGFCVHGQISNVCKMKFRCGRPMRQALLNPTLVIST